MIGRVIKSYGNIYFVRTDSNTVQAGLRGKLRLIDHQATNPIAVGDLVEIEKTDEWQISRVLDRKNKITRRAISNTNHEHVLAANIDQLIIVSSITQPHFHFNFVDRCLITAEAFSIEPIIVVTKNDLKKNDDLTQEIREVYSFLNVPVYIIDARNHEDVMTLIDILKNRVSALTGQSGVGKSTLIKTLNPGLEIKIGETSKKWSVGKHTTTSTEIFEVLENAFIIDTPGLREFGLIDMEESELSHYFREMIPFLEDCKFSKCTHTHEPKCAVKEALEKGLIHPKRYENYIQILSSLEEN